MPEVRIDQRMIELLKPVNIILDVGCGDGRLVNALVLQKQRRVVGLDISNHGFTEAKSTARQTTHHHLVECVECDARQIAIRDDHFEAVIMTFSLHHIEETQAALKEIHRILEPGGMALIGEWMVEDEGQPRDGCFRFTFEEMKQMMWEITFQQVEVEKIETDMVLVVAVK